MATTGKAPFASLRTVESWVWRSRARDTHGMSAPFEFWTEPPPREVPAVAPVDRCLVATPTTAIWITALVVYSTGLEFVCSLNADGEEFSGPDPFRWHGTPESDLGCLRFEVTSDAGTAVWPLTEVPPRGPILRERWSIGGNRRWTIALWHCPVPRAETFAVACTWGDRGIDTGGVRLDAGLVRAAVERVHDPWATA